MDHAEARSRPSPVKESRAVGMLTMLLIVRSEADTPGEQIGRSVRIGLALDHLVDQAAPLLRADRRLDARQHRLVQQRQHLAARLASAAAGELPRLMHRLL